MRLLKVSALGLVAALAGCNGKQGPAPAAKTEADKRVLERLNGRIRRVDFNDIELPDVIQFFRDVSDVPIEVDYDAVRGAGIKWNRDTVRLYLRDVAMHTALALCLAEAAKEKPIGYIVKDGRIHISTPEGLEKLREGAAQPATGEGSR